MKKMLLICALLHPSLQTSPIIDEIAKNFVEKQGDTLVVTPNVAELLRNDGLFVETTGPISLKDAAEKTQRTWCNKEWKHTATEEDIQKSSRIAEGTRLLNTLYREQIATQDLQSDIIIAHAGVLPSAIKMFLAAQKAYDATDARTLFVVTSNEPFNNDNIKQTPLDAYTQAATLLGSDYTLPAVTEDSKPTTEREVVELVRQGFAQQMPDLKIEYIEKKKLPAFAQTFDRTTKGMVVSSYPQVEAHALSFSSLTKSNPNLKIVAGVTAGPQDKYEQLYDAQSKEERYNFDRNNFARILYRLQEHYSAAK